MQHMLTTIDNPHDPFTAWDEWKQWDESHGYFSSQLLARVAFTSDDISQADQDEAIEAAILEIVRENVSGMHKRVSLEFESTAPS